MSPTTIRPKGPGNSGTTMVSKIYQGLPAWQRAMMFVGGFVVVLGSIGAFLWLEVVSQHEESAMALGVEVGATTVLVLFGFTLMVPPLGMWLIRVVPDVVTKLRRKRV